MSEIFEASRHREWTAQWVERGALLALNGIVITLAIGMLAGCSQQSSTNSTEAVSDNVSAEMTATSTSADGYPERPRLEEQELAPTEALLNEVSGKIAALSEQRTVASAEANSATETAGSAKKATEGDRSEGSAPPPAFLADGNRVALISSIKTYLATTDGHLSCDTDAHRAVLSAIEDSIKSGLPTDEGQAFSQSDIRKLEAAGVVDPFEAIRPCYSETKPSNVSWSLDGWIGKTCALVSENIKNSDTESQKYDAPSPANIADSVFKSCSLVSPVNVNVSKRAKEIQQFYRWFGAAMAMQQVAARQEKAAQLAAIAASKNDVVTSIDGQLVELTNQSNALTPKYQRYLALRQAREGALAQLNAARDALAAKRAAEEAKKERERELAAQKELEDDPDLCLKKRLSPDSFLDSYRRYGSSNPSEPRVVASLISGGDYRVVNIRPEGNGCRVTVQVSGIADGNSFNRTLEGWAL